jgi:[methyl-Co(III) methanol-specific corrinoid protein]:coenzyme M methyltransferase
LTSKTILRNHVKKLGDDAIILGQYDVFALPCAEETTVEMAVEGIKTKYRHIWWMRSGPGCDLWPDIKEENFRAMEKTTREYKTGPTPAVGRI